MRIIEKLFTTKENGVAGFLSYPERAEPGPALFLIHPKGGLGEYIKTETRKFAKLGYTHLCDQRLRATRLSGANPYRHRFTDPGQDPDPEFTRVLTEGWRFLLKQPPVNKSRVAVCGYCMGGRIAIHFVAATPEVRAFVGYYPTVRDEPETPLRPVHPSVAATKIRCPSINLIRRRRCHHRAAGAGTDVASLQRERPAAGMALLSVRRPWLRRSRSAGIQRSRG